MPAVARVEEVVDLLALIPAAKEKFIKGTKRHENASGLFIEKNGSITEVQNHVCHAYLGRSDGVILINGLQTGESYGNNPGRILSKEVELWFVDYILNRSPYSQIFIEKDAVKALEEQITVASGDHPGNLVGAGLVALRRLWEYVYVARCAYDLVQLGVNEDLAFFLGHMIQVGNSPKDGSKASWNACTNGHSSINPSIMGWKELKRFLEHNVKSPNANFSEGGEYCYYDSMYGSGGGARKEIQQMFSEALRGIKQPAKEKANSNPFLAAKEAENKFVVGLVIASGETAYKKAIEIMAELAKGPLMEKINNA